jgi:hypothetical protein
MPADALDIIRTRRHAKLAEKDEIYRLLDDSYRGGFAYIRGNHLPRHDREYTEAYKKRVARSVYVNYLQPMVDLLTGFVFKNEPRRVYPPSLEYVLENAAKRKSLDAFIRSVCTTAFMYTTGVLVDSPAFDAEKYPTQAARREAKLNPYACAYAPWQIRDFACDEWLNLEWILLDDSRIEKLSATEPASARKIYRLWTKTTFQDFEIVREERTGREIVVPGEVYAHPVGYVPFHFVNARDIDDDYVSDSPFEDVAILSRLDYSILSYFEEMLAAGTFKTLFFPVLNKDELPSEIRKKGLSDSPLVAFNGSMSQAPFFAGAKLEEITPYKEARNMLALEMFRKIGMDLDRDKSYVQSGAAMGKEFEKTEALLNNMSDALSECEEFIFRTCARWEGTNADEAVEVEYSKKFQGDDVNARLVRLYQLYNTGEPAVREETLRGIVELTLPNVDAEKIVSEAVQREPDVPSLELSGEYNSNEVMT